VSSASGTTVTIDAGLSGSAPGRLRVVLQGRPATGGGIELTTSSAAIGPAATPSLYTGSVTSLAGDQLVLGLSDGRTRIGVVVQLQLGAGTQVTGTVQGGASAGRGGGDD